MYNPNQSASSRRAGEEFLRRMNQSEYQNHSSCSPSSRQTQRQSCAQSVAVNCCERQENDGCNQNHNRYMPALAMVYSPVQEWACLMESPEKALASGTLFQELFKPFEGRGRRATKC